MSKKRIIIVGVLVLTIIATIIGVNYIKAKRQEELNKKLESKEDGIEKYLTGKSATVEEFLAECDLTISDINAMTIGMYIEDEFNRFYIDDETVVKNMCEMLNDVVIHGVNGEIISSKYETGQKWRIILYSDKEYSFVIRGFETTDDNIDSLMVGVSYDGNDSSIYYRMINGEREEWDIAELIESYSRQLIMNENITEYIYDIYEENIRNITKEEMMRLKSEGKIERQDIFKFNYKKMGNGSVEGYISEDGEAVGLNTIIYYFPIDGTECYIEVERESTTVHKEVNIDGKIFEEPVFRNDIVRVEIHNKSGDELDFYKATKEELEEFIN